MLSSPEVTFDPPAESEVIQAELEELRRTAESLEEELRQLHSLVREKHWTLNIVEMWFE